nr:zinc finger BED domain-containing protein RICESLEEPER 2-like [Ipomoea batatas]
MVFPLFIEILLMQMPWRDNLNHVDCGIYTMRHMETFRGQTFKTWDCGLVRGDAYLRNLRMVYMREILMAEINDLRLTNIKRARKFQHELFLSYVTQGK